MARKIQSRITVTGMLKAESPIHVGGINNNPIVDLSLALNGQGQYYIPGTSLTGALRGWLEANSGDQIQSQDIKNLFGHQDKDNGHASFLLIEDAVINNSKDIKQEIRDGVGIDRYTGAAADKTKFDRAILPTGTEIRFNLTLEVDGKVDKNGNSSVSKSKSLIVTLIKALQESKIRLGAAKTRGLGKVKLENVNLREICFQNRENLLASLRGEGNAIALDQISTASLGTATPQLDLTIHWQPQGALMVKSAADGIAVDILPLVSAKNGKTTFVIPGSSIKGALRSQAERIMRTVLSYPPDHNSIEIPLINEIFGRATKTQLDNQGKKQQLGRLGLLYIDDCYSTLSMKADEWEKIRASKESSDLRKNLDDLAILNAANAKLKHTQQAFHVAIDRWTGGAADNFLYSNLEPMNVDWEPIQISLKLPQKDELELKSYLALLFLLIRDLQSDRIPLGYGVNRGMGAIQLTNIELKISGINNLLLPDLKFPTELKGGNIADLKEILPILTEAWQDKIKSLQEVKS